MKKYALPGTMKSISKRFWFVEEPAFTECSFIHRLNDPLYEVFEQQTKENDFSGQLHIIRTLSDAYKRMVFDWNVITKNRRIWKCDFMIRQHVLAQFVLDT